MPEILESTELTSLKWTDRAWKRQGDVANTTSALNKHLQRQHASTKLANPSREAREQKQWRALRLAAL